MLPNSTNPDMGADFDAALLKPPGGIPTAQLLLLRA